MSEGIMYYGYTDNEEFLTRAALGTRIRFNNVGTIWTKQPDGGWRSGDYTLAPAHNFGNKATWTIHVEAWGHGGRTPEQNARIVAKLEELMEAAVDNVKNGDTPSDVDVLWMGMILDCIEEGEKG